MKSAALRTCWIILFAFPVLFLGSQLFSQDGDEIEEAQTESSQGGSGSEMDNIDLHLQMDADGDGIITMDEWNRLFVKIDENGDKRLSPQEMQSALSRNAGKTDSYGGRAAAFDRLDANGNGAIEFSEWPGIKKGFTSLDSNRDNSLSRTEFVSKNARWWNQVFENVDLNGNGLITRAEWMDSGASFDRLDRNHDGGIERREFYNPR